MTLPAAIMVATEMDYEEDDVVLEDDRLWPCVVKRGGPRIGAGRPAGSKTSIRTELVSVRMTPLERAKAEALGWGNASAGVRIALASCPVREP